MPLFFRPTTFPHIRGKPLVIGDKLIHDCIAAAQSTLAPHNRLAIDTQVRTLTSAFAFSCYSNFFSWLHYSGGFSALLTCPTLPLVNIWLLRPLILQSLSSLLPFPPHLPKHHFRGTIQPRAITRPSSTLSMSFLARSIS